MADIVDRVNEEGQALGATVKESGDKARHAPRAGSEWAAHIAGEAAKSGAAADTAGSPGQEGLDLASPDVAQLLGGEAASAEAAEATESGTAPRRSGSPAWGDGVSDLGAEMMRIIGEQKMTSLLVAGAAGYLLAYLLHGRRR